MVRDRGDSSKIFEVVYKVRVVYTKLHSKNRNGCKKNNDENNKKDI